MIYWRIIRVWNSTTHGPQFVCTSKVSSEKCTTNLWEWSSCISIPFTLIYTIHICSGTVSLRTPVTVGSVDRLSHNETSIVASFWYTFFLRFDYNHCHNNGNNNKKTKNYCWNDFLIVLFETYRNFHFRVALVVFNLYTS